MLVVADATPINILVRIDQIELLPALFGQVLIPPKVHAELSHARTPDSVRSWLAGNPPWLEVRAPKQAQHPMTTGEEEAIALAVQLGTCLFLVDDRRARRDAIARGIPIAGTLGVLERAARQGMIDLPSVIARLRTTDFHIADAELDAILERWEAATAPTLAVRR